MHQRLLCSRCQALWGIVPRLLHHRRFRHDQLAVCVLTCSQLLALHRTATLRHDSLGQETLLNLLLRNHLAFNLYDQVLQHPPIDHRRIEAHCLHIPTSQPNVSTICGRGLAMWHVSQPRCTRLQVLKLVTLQASLHFQAEALRSKAQRPEVSRSATQAARYLYYHGRILAVQLDYTAARDTLQQAARKVCAITTDTWRRPNLSPATWDRHQRQPHRLNDTPMQHRLQQAA